MSRRLAVWVALALVVAPTVGVWGEPAAAAASGQSSYIVLMKIAPLVRSISTRSLDTAAARSRRAELHRAQAGVVAATGLPASAVTTTFTNALNGFAVRATATQARALAARPDVALVLPDELRHPAVADAKDWPISISVTRGNGNQLYDFLGLTGRSESWQSGINGSGVTIGVIDTGIWPEHPSFADDGHYPVHPALDAGSRSTCAFGNTAHNPADARFTCNNKVVGARVFLDTYKANHGLSWAEFDSARDDEGHGTHTASTAAGNAGIHARVFGVDKGLTSGIAPRAQIIAYKALGGAGGFTSDLVAAIDQAVADGVDVINYSVGSSPSTVSPDALALLYAADAGVFASVSAGNSGPGPKTIGGPADVPWVTTVGANTQPTFYEGFIEAGGKRYRGASVTGGTSPAKFVDAATAGGALCLGGTLNPAVVTGAIVVCTRGGNGRVDKSAEVLRAGGVGMVLANASDTDTLFSDTFFVPTAMIDASPGAQLRAWIAATPGGTGRLVPGSIGVSPFVSPTMAAFSSRGENPTAGDLIKPDLTAPGVQIMAGNTPMPASGQPASELFQAIAGTSMSAPVVAGSFALLKQAHPDWTPAMAKSALMTTADTRVRDNDRVSAATPFAMGAGMLDLGEPQARGSAYRPGLVYDATFDDYVGFLCAEGRAALVNPIATCAALAASGIPTRAADLNVPSIGVENVVGSTFVTRRVTNVTGVPARFVARIQAPPGYAVSVSPSRLTLNPGATATFTVSISNVGAAPVGEWRFGSLTWKGGGGFEVRSPIAVKAATVAPPVSSAESASAQSVLATSLAPAAPAAPAAPRHSALLRAVEPLWL